MSVLQVEHRTSEKPAHLRRKGLLPMALVGRDHKTVLIQASEQALRKAMAGADGLGRLDLEVEGEKKARKVMLKHIEKNFVRQEILCVILVEVSADDIIKIDIPVIALNIPEEFEGHGLSFTQPTDMIKVRGKMSLLPERIELDVSSLEVGHHISAGDLTLPEGIELLSSPDSTIFSLAHLKVASLEPETAPEEEGGEAAEGEEAAAAEGEGETEAS
jgi:large subunit ribosomal protein L25